MKKSLLLLIYVCFLCACHESLEEKAAREAAEYTKRCCPTPVINCTRTDSVKFDIPTRTYLYYCSFTDEFDNQETVNANRQALHKGLYENISTNTGLKQLIDAGIQFAYIVHSDKNPSQVLYRDTIVIK